MTHAHRWALAAALVATAACKEETTPLELNGPAADVAIAGGNNQTGAAGSPLPQSLIVFVTDVNGLPVPAREVLWGAEQGILSATVDSTDDAGGSSVTWTLGEDLGPQRVTATVEGVGSVTFLATAIPPGGALVFRFIDAGSYHSCGITTTEELYCWGYNGDGQLGIEPSEARDLPTRIPETERFRLVTGGRYHSCGITLSGEAACWGENKDGRLGERPFPTTFQNAQAGYVHSCGLSLSRKLFCWGYNREGQLGVGVTPEPFLATPSLVGEGYKAATVNGLHTCALREDSTAECWGFGGEGQLGNGTAITQFVPTPVVSPTLFRIDPGIAPPAPDPDFPLPDGPFIAAGFAHTCAIGVDDRAYCWGLNQDGQLGTGGTALSLLPVAVGTAQSFVRITAGHRHTCALTAAGQAFCWGDNTHGQLGDGTGGPGTPDRLSPVAVSGGHVFVYLKAGELHTCGVTEAGVAWCWGDNEYGQLGIGRPVGQPRRSLAPVKVAFQP